MTIVRPEQADDAARIYAIHAGCFPSTVEARLVDLLRAAGRLQVSLVAEADGQLVGHIAFSPVTTDAGGTGAGLAPVAVVESRQGRGIAAALVRAGLLACREAGLGWAVVLGDPAFYGRFGFGAAAEFGLFDEYQAADAFQALELIPGQLPSGAGLVRYAPEFATVGETTP